jgi:sn1-specific diacylglycerol lipase
MYTTASLILKKIKNLNLLGREFAKPEFRHYRLVVTGHSLGAGVASVLSVILKRDYPDLVCYAFSPPGCIFRWG